MGQKETRGAKFPWLDLTSLDWGLGGGRSGFDPVGQRAKGDVTGSGSKKVRTGVCVCLG